MIRVIEAKQLWQTLIRLFLVFLISLAIFLFFPRIVFAKVVINEFQIKPDQWIELYNKGEDSIDISGWIIDDDGGTEKYIISSGIMLPSKRCMSFSGGKFNWNTTSEDTVRLLDSNFNLKEEYIYSSTPGEGISIGRVIDGEGDLVVLVSSSRDKFNTTGESCLALTITPTPIPTSTPTSKSPTPTPKSAATYKINEVKSEDGEVLSSVKVYLDGIYIHHYAPEVLTFCDGCQCDTDVDCGYGEHIIRLEKSGFDNCNEEIMVNAGYYKEANPVMNLSDSVLLTSTSTPIPTSTPTLPIPTLKAVAVLATFSGEILGNQSSESGNFYALETTPSANLEKKLEEDVSLSFLPKVILLIGMVFLLSGGLWLWYNLKH